MIGSTEDLGNLFGSTLIIATGVVLGFLAISVAFSLIVKIGSWVLPESL